MKHGFLVKSAEINWKQIVQLVEFENYSTSGSPI